MEEKGSGHALGHVADDGGAGHDEWLDWRLLGGSSMVLLRLRWSYSFVREDNILLGLWCYEQKVKVT